MVEPEGADECVSATYSRLVAMLISVLGLDVLPGNMTVTTA